MSSKDIYSNTDVSKFKASATVYGVDGMAMKPNGGPVLEFIRLNWVARLIASTSLSYY